MADMTSLDAGAEEFGLRGERAIKEGLVIRASDVVGDQNGVLGCEKTSEPATEGERKALGGKNVQKGEVEKESVRTRQCSWWKTAMPEMKGASSG